VLGSGEHGLVYRDAIVYESPRGSFYDSHIGGNIPAIEGVTLANPDQYPICEWSV